MRIHTDNLTHEHFRRAAEAAGVGLEVFSMHGSRKRDHAFEVQLSGSNPYSAQSGAWKAATWDEWGNFLAELFKAEPTMVAGPYDGQDDFFVQTGEAIVRNAHYERAVGRKRPGVTAPWL